MEDLRIRSLFEKYQRIFYPEVEFGTVADYVDSKKNLPDLCVQGDLKDLERPWAVKAIMSKIPKGGRLLEIGGGAPTVSNFLYELGYDVTLIDPFEGSGNGPTEYQFYKENYPHLKIIKGLFNDQCDLFEKESFDCIFSISVLEHIPSEEIPSIANGIKKFSKPGSYTIHNIDHIQLGNGADWSSKHMKCILDNFGHLGEWAKLEDQISVNPEIFFMSVDGHLLWKGETPYSQFPFRRCIALNICSRLW